MTGLDVDQTLAHVADALSHSHHEESVGIPVVVTGKGTQAASQPRVVGARPDDALSQDGVDGALLISVISELGQHVHHGVVWSSDTQES